MKSNRTQPDAPLAGITSGTKWPNSGFFFWGNVFQNLGAKTQTLTDGPTAANSEEQLTSISSSTPTLQTETEKPNFIGPQHVKAITEWVKAAAASSC